jgi:hypothetical protein
LNNPAAFNDKDILDLLNGIEKGIFNLFSESGFIPKGMPMGDLATLSGGMP